MDLFSVSADGSGLTRLTNRKGLGDASWSPDGSKIVAGCAKKPRAPPVGDLRDKCRR